MLAGLAVVAVAAAALVATFSGPWLTATAHGDPLDGTGGALTAADGTLPAGTGAFDDELPGIANLDAALLRAIQAATMDAEAVGVELTVNSGWRSADYQQQLLVDAVAEHGSIDEASRWVATPESSAHVSGDAVDVGPPAAAGWLAEHGGVHGLCRTYDNEPWHFELLPAAVDDGCPLPYADPTVDPRLR